MTSYLTREGTVMGYLDKVSVLAIMTDWSIKAYFSGNHVGTTISQSIAKMTQAGFKPGA